MLRSCRGQLSESEYLMTQIRLTHDKRQRLHKLARDLVTCHAEKKALNEAYKIAAPLVRKIVEARYPRRDMMICQKYQVADIDDTIRLNLTAGGVEEFKFKDKTGPLAVAGYCSNRMFQADDAATDAVMNWVRARDSYRDAIKTKLSDYRALIEGARTFEQVLTVWPEAETLRSDMGSTALIVLSDEVVDRIKADVAQRRAA